MHVTTERTRPVSRRWALLPMGGVLLLAAAVYERAWVQPPHEYVLCKSPTSLGVVFWVVVSAVLAAGLVCAIGVMHLVIDTPARITAPLVYAAIALTAVVGSDALDHVGAGIAARTAEQYRTAGESACDYPMPAYHETPGWFF
ncbi:hypothetical protein [Kitasatospora sp. DSM 101779]|uniref:hypothetical protein n=1 Tax=Kitasatospora sp. DSM 101779 TaxID=2853165 RepID=UPI0021D99007|nr:hypothetical protein [Kitasatospora sp. DSM 101779]MCU7826718.1 hypothetical protein [Kitasatospora sp. DSM 101779]